MVNWFKRKVINWLRDDPKEVYNTIGTISQPVPSVSTRRMDRMNGMNFTIHQANGGYIMEYSSYDHNTDRRDSNLHIITNDQDLGQSISHIITLELLRK